MDRLDIPYESEPEPEPEPEPEQMNRTEGGVVEVTLKALYSYTADEDDELSFEEGDEIVKLSEPDSEGMIQIHFYYETRIISRVDGRKTSANGFNSSIFDRNVR